MAASLFRPPTTYRLPALPVRASVESQAEESGSRLVNLLASQDAFFGLAGNPTMDWPVPAGRIPPLANRTCTNSLLNAPFALDGVPRKMHDWPVPAGRAFPSDLRTHTDPLKVNLLNKDALFGAAGEVPAYDWQNPRGRTPAVLLRTWHSNQPSGPILYDIIFPPTKMHDWPVPKGRTPAILLRTWTDPLKQTLYGKDKFYGASGQPPEQRDFPNPRGRTSPIALRTWTDGLKLNLGSQDSLPPRQSDFPVPRGRLPAIALRTHLEALKRLLIGQDVFYAGVGQAPEQRDWPVPRGRVPAVSLRTHVQPLDLARLGSDTFFAAPGMGPHYDYPNPLGRQPAVALRTHVQSLNLLAGQDTIFAGMGIGCRYDYPNPLGRVPANDLRTFLHRTDVPLIGQDQFFAAAGEAPRYDYPNPGRKPYPSYLLQSYAVHAPSFNPPIAFPSLVVMALGCYNPVVVSGYYDPDVHSPLG